MGRGHLARIGLLATVIVHFSFSIRFDPVAICSYFYLRKQRAQCLSLKDSGQDERAIRRRIESHEIKCYGALLASISGLRRLRIHLIERLR